jgi:hypothetical protein
MEENRIPKRVLYMNFESTRPRNRWQGEMRKKYITERNGRRS